MKHKLIFNAALGIATEVLYAMCIILLGYIVSFSFFFKI